MRDLLQLLDDLNAGTGDLSRLAGYHEAARARVQTLRDQLATAEGFAQQMQEHLNQHSR
jgi:hypothetical protein